MLLNPFQPSIAFHVETSHIFYSANEITNSYVKCNTGVEKNKFRVKICSISKMLQGL